MIFSTSTLYLMHAIVSAIILLITFVIKEIDNPKAIVNRIIYYAIFLVLVSYLIVMTNGYYSHKKKKVMIDDTITINLLNDQSPKFFANTVQVDTPFSTTYATNLWLEINVNGKSKKIKVKRVFHNNMKYSFSLQSIQKAQNILAKLSKLEMIFNP